MTFGRGRGHIGLSADKLRSIAVRGCDIGESRSQEGSESERKGLRGNATNRYILQRGMSLPRRRGFSYLCVVTRSLMQSCINIILITEPPLSTAQKGMSRQENHHSRPYRNTVLEANNRVGNTDKTKTGRVLRSRVAAGRAYGDYGIHT